MDLEKIVIIGSGPAGYTAAIYSARAKLNPLLFEGSISNMEGQIPGGQLMTTTIVENFPGFPEGIAGADLMENMKKQALNFDLRIVKEKVIRVDLSSYPYMVFSEKNSFKANAIIIATGAKPRVLEIPGKDKFWQKGVSTCATCDGASPIFRNKNIFVIGGGDSAVEEALFLTRFALKVFIVHRRDSLRASKFLALKAIDHPKIEIIWNTELIEIFGEDIVKGIVLKNIKTNKEERIEAAGIFFAIGHIPNTEFLNGQLPLKDNKYLIVKGNSTYTEKEGVFAAGDVQDFSYRQAIVASSLGCKAAIDCERWLQEKGLL